MSLERGIVPKDLKIAKFIPTLNSWSFHVDEEKLFIKGMEINKVTTACFLGLMVDERFAWKEQVDYVADGIIKYYSRQPAVTVSQEFGFFYQLCIFMKCYLHVAHT